MCSFLFVLRNPAPRPAVIKRGHDRAFRLIDARTLITASFVCIVYASSLRCKVRANILYVTTKPIHFPSIRREIRARRDRPQSAELVACSFAFPAFPRKVRTERRERERASMLNSPRLSSSVADTHVVPSNLIFFPLPFLFSPALRLPEPYKSDTTDGRRQSALHVRYERARAQGLGHICKFLSPPFLYLKLIKLILFLFNQEIIE